MIKIKGSSVIAEEPFNLHFSSFLRGVIASYDASQSGRLYYWCGTIFDK